VQSSAENSRTAILAHPFFVWALILTAALAVVSAFIQPANANGNAFQETAQRFAERIAATPGLRGPLRLDWHPDDKWQEGESVRWREAIRGELEKRGVTLTEEAAAPELALNAQETPTQVVLTAKVHVGEREEVRIVEVARSLLPPSESPVAPVRLDRQMIYETPDRILDASSLWNATEGGLAVLLYRDYVVVAQRVDARGAVQQSVALNSAGLKPIRDPRAEMNPHGSMISVQLWGKACDFSWETPGDVKCYGDKPTAARKSVWREPTVLTSPCDESAWKLSSSGNEPNARDALHVIPDSTLRESSSGVLSEFPGPILSMNAEPNPSSALVVTRNLHTGNYEVYKITLACSD
jgi:hypothetical protein